LNSHNVIQVFLAQTKHQPNSLALKEGQRSMTYGELGNRVAQLQYKLSSHSHIPPIIGIYAEDNFNMVVGILAICSLGAAYTPLTNSMPATQMQNIIDDLELPLLLAEEDSPTFMSCKKIPIEFSPADTVGELPEPLNQDLAYVLYTSGSTGNPKGVAIKKTGLLALVSFFQKNNAISSEDKFLQCADWTFDLSVWTLFLSLNSGACCVCLPNKQIGFVEILSALQSEKITCLNVVPSLVQFGKKYFDELSLPDLRLCVFAGEALKSNLAEAWSVVAPNCQIENHYGLTEACVHISRFRYARTENPPERTYVSIGQIYPHLSWALRSSEGTISPTAKEGELLIAGSQIIDQYIGNQFKERFVDAVSPEPIRYFCTGDWVEVDEEENLHFVKRIDRQFQLNGYRIEPSEIENCIASNLDRQAVVFSHTNESQIDELIAIIEGPPLSNAKCTEELRAHLAVHKIPSQMHYIDTFPINKNGKINRKQIEQSFKAK